MLRSILRDVRSTYRAGKAFDDGRKFSAETAWKGGDAGFSSWSKTDLDDYFDNNTDGPGIWKWRHYFEVYDRHLAKFRGHAPSLAEIGIYSGGSLPMWQSYLGPGTIINGVDIEENCRSYAGENINVFIGDQEDRAFWAKFRDQVPVIDIIIDDGGHEPQQQLVSLEEMLPHLAPGGVYICEDVHGSRHSFAEAVYGMASALNDNARMSENHDDPERRIVQPTTPFQSAIKGISFYPYLVVIEKRETPLAELVAPKHGTIWEPFLT